MISPRIFSLLLVVVHAAPIRPTSFGDMAPICQKQVPCSCVDEVKSIFDQLMQGSTFEEDVLRMLLLGRYRTHVYRAVSDCVIRQLKYIRSAVLMPIEVFTEIVKFNQGLDYSPDQSTVPLSEIVEVVGSRNYSSNCRIHFWYNEVFLGNVGLDSSLLPVRYMFKNARFLTYGKGHPNFVGPPPSAIRSIISHEIQRLVQDLSSPRLVRDAETIQSVGQLRRATETEKRLSEHTEAPNKRIRTDETNLDGLDDISAGDWDHNMLE